MKYEIMLCDYPSLRLASTLTRQNNLFEKNYFVNLDFHIFTIYYHIFIWRVKLFRCNSNNYDSFQHLNFIFTKKKNSLFKKLFNDEIDLGVRYLNFSKTTNFGFKNIPHSKKIGEFFFFCIVWSNIWYKGIVFACYEKMKY
jgi:hypothetical protein